MVELERARELLGSMGFETVAALLDVQMERSLHAEHTYAQFLDELLTFEQQERGRKGEKMRTKLAQLKKYGRIRLQLSIFHRQTAD
jgi:hypothetical protein